MNHRTKRPDGWVFISFSSSPPSDRLRNCRGATATPSRSVTAAAFPRHRTARGPHCVRFCHNPCQHGSSIHCPFLQFGLDSRLAASCLDFLFACARADAGLGKRKQRAHRQAAGAGCDTEHARRHTRLIQVGIV